MAPTITIERMTQDGIELAEWLRKTLQKNKIIIVGHSWGSILGVFMAKARPDLFVNELVARVRPLAKGH